MKLYELPRYTYFTLKDDPDKNELFFDHVDGMYSYCKDKDSNVIHLPAWTEVWIVDEKGEYTS